MANPEFNMHHYAGSVKYTTTGFLNKNRDVLAVEITGCMAIAQNHIVAVIFGGEEGAIGGKARKVSAAKALSKAKQSTKNIKGKRSGAATNFLAKQFKASLVSLMDDLNKAEPHFIRCIKPNQAKSKEWEVEDEYATRQLRYTGMLDTTRIRREGYPSRPTFADFMERYKILGHPMSKEVPPTGPNCQEILAHAGVSEAKIGKTKVFMKHYHGQALDEKLKPFSSAAMLIGKFGVGFLARARCRPVIEHKRKQDSIVKAWLETIPKLANPFAVTCQTGKDEDGEAMLALWKKREDEGKPPPVSIAKTDASVAEQIKRSASRREPKTGKPTRDQVIEFYKTMGDQQGAGQTEDGRFCAWFHGIVSRSKAEKLLASEQDGTFIIRLAESRYVPTDSPLILFCSSDLVHLDLLVLDTHCQSFGVDESSTLPLTWTAKACTRFGVIPESIDISTKLWLSTKITLSPIKVIDCCTRATQVVNVTTSRSSRLKTMSRSSREPYTRIGAIYLIYYSALLTQSHISLRHCSSAEHNSTAL